MPVVGEAHIIVRALTNKVAGDIKNGFDGVRGDMAEKAGATLGQKFSSGFNKRLDANRFTRLSDAIQKMAPRAEAARTAINALIVKGYKTSAMAAVVTGSISALISGLGALAGAAGAASVGLIGMLGAFISLKVGMSIGKFAFGGIGAAVSSATAAQGGYTKSLKETRKELKQLKFDAEQAALSEEQAALDLEAARENLARTADLPANSAARRQAELDFKQAELNYRQAKSKTEEANKEARKGVQGIAGGAGGGGADPYAGLNQSQKEFAKFVVSTLLPIQKRLREAASSGFLPILKKALEELVNSGLVGVLADGFYKVGAALGVGVTAITEMLAKGKNLNMLDRIFGTIAKVVTIFLKAIAPFLESFLIILDAARPVILLFAKAVKKTAINFKDFLTETAKNDGLKNFFTTAYEMLKMVSGIFKNIFGGIGELILANFGEGSGGYMLLEWLQTATAGLTNLTTDERADLRTYFAAVATNLMKLVGGFGALFKAFGSLGADPNLGLFFDAIAGMAPALTDLLGKISPVLPIIGKLLTIFIDIFNKLADTGAIENFFNTWVTMAEFVSDLLDNKVVQGILGVTGQVHAFTLALSGGFDIFKQLGLFGVGSFGKYAEIFGMVADEAGGLKDVFGVLTESISSGLTKSGGFFKEFGKTFSGGFDALMNSNSKFISGFAKGFNSLKGFIIGNPILAIIILLAGLFITLYLSNKKFADGINKIMGPALKALGDMFERIMVALQPLIDAFMELMDVLFSGAGGDALMSIFTLLAQVISDLVVAFAPLIANLVEFFVPLLVDIIKIITPLIGFFASLIQLVAEFWKALITGDWSKFGEIFSKVFSDMGSNLVKFFEGVVNLIIDGLNVLAFAYFNSIGKPIAEFVSLVSNKSIDLTKPNLIPHVRFTPLTISSKAVNKSMAKRGVGGLAEGGIVSARPGGSMAVIGEAGRPERVEPLDPDGLSRRDKAMIQFLTNGTAGGGVNITINPSAGMDEKELAAVVSRRLAYELRRGATA